MIDQYINKIINADCLDILRQLPDKCIDLVLTDPPYGIGVDKMTMFDGAKNKKGIKNTPIFFLPAMFSMRFSVFPKTK